eukprot:scaffold2893_cov254-Pinguiococcus_pyrenoidosus.AAC.29
MGRTPSSAMLRALSTRLLSCNVNNTCALLQLAPQTRRRQPRKSARASHLPKTPLLSLETQDRPLGLSPKLSPIRRHRGSFLGFAGIWPAPRCNAGPSCTEPPAAQLGRRISASLIRDSEPIPPCGAAFGCACVLHIWRGYAERKQIKPSQASLPQESSPPQESPAPRISKSACGEARSSDPRERSAKKPSP